MNKSDFDDIFSDLADDADMDFDGYDISSEPYTEYDNKRISCSFTGHRIISAEERISLVPALKSTILYLISLGVKEFHCGGAMGFDTLAAGVVFDVSREHPEIKLILELPYENQSSKWKDADKRFYDFVKSKANEINVYSANPKNKDEAVNALLKRNRKMIDKSYYCVCFLKENKGGTAYTVNYAKLHDLHIINLAEQE